ncbi:hypothetical protein ACFFSY_31040 [Paenibacillus aurantiacus]|uniref:DUF4129 domain-containing protein n=1 Tax=Paenibacillus aurantiacus TaxID=1936118 RepID=A0ABV5KYT6_9BACL
MMRIREAGLVLVQGVIECIIYLPLLLIADGLVQPAVWERGWWLVPLLGYPIGYLLGRRAAFRQPSVTLLLTCVCGLGVGTLLFAVFSAGIAVAIAASLGCTIGLYRGARAALAPWAERFTSAHFSIGLLIYVLYSFILQRNERFAVPSALLLAGGVAAMMIMLLVVNHRTVRAESAAPGADIGADAAVRSRNVRLSILVLMVTLLLAVSGSLQVIFRAVWGEAAAWIRRLLAPKEPAPAPPPPDTPVAPPPSMLPAGEPTEPSPWWDWVMYGFIGIVGLFILIAIIRRLPLVPALLRGLLARLTLWLRRERLVDQGNYQDEVDRIVKPERKGRSFFGIRRRNAAMPRSGGPADRLVHLYRTWLSERHHSSLPFDPSRTPIEIGQAEALREGADGDRHIGTRLTRAYSAYRYGGIEAKDEELTRLAGEIRPRKPKK